MRHETCCLTGLLMAGALHASPAERTYAQTSADEFFQLIRANKLNELERLAATPQAGGIADALQNTPLHYASLYGSADAVRILLTAGLSVDARNSQDATPLIYAAYDLRKTQLLVEGGAKVNVTSQMGQTPLIVAASAQGSAATVRYLLEKGANPMAANRVGNDALMNAAAFSEEETVRVLLANGAEAKATNKGAGNALMNAVTMINDGRVTALLAAGADVNATSTFAGAAKNVPLALVRLSALLLAAPYAELQTIDELLAAGAHVDHTDARKMTPLMLAVSTDFSKLETVERLIAAGADVNATDQNGESVLDWAVKFGEPQIIGCLQAAGARNKARREEAPTPPGGYRPPNATEALARSTALLAKSGHGFFSEGDGCWGCHHQPMDARTYAAVRNAGLPADERLRALLRNALIAGRPRTMTLSTVLVDMGGDFDTMLSPLAAMADLNEPATSDTDTLIHYIAARQQPSGAWHAGGIARPPLEDSDISRTALAVRALKVYGWQARQAEFDNRIQKGRAWLLQANASTNYERADLLMGLFFADANKSDVWKAAANLLEQQTSGGGWSQTKHLPTDAYATGMALHALFITGMLKPEDEPYQRGIAFLLNTQFPDGSWYVRSRAPRFQPFFESAFPFGHDQWISSTATGWAAMALAPAAAIEAKAAAANSNTLAATACFGVQQKFQGGLKNDGNGKLRRITIGRWEVA